MYSFIDVEASGLGVGSYPIEVGVALPNGKTRCTLICPPPHWSHWDGSAEDVHGISRDQLLVNGRSVFKVAMMLNEWLDGQTVYTDAWGNDSCWLARLFAEAGITQRFNVDSIVQILTDAQQSRWHQTREQVQQSLAIDRHRASNDALVIQQTCARLMHNGPVQAQLHTAPGSAPARKSPTAA